MNCRNSIRWITCIAVVSLTATACASASEMPTAEEYTNSIGMKLVRIEGGTFQMGQLKTPLPSEILPKFRGGAKLTASPKATMTKSRFTPSPLPNLFIWASSR